MALVPHIIKLDHLKGVLSDCRIIRYDTSVYAFDKIAASILSVPDLSALHSEQIRLKKAQGVSGRISYEDNMSLRERFRKLDQESVFYRTYRAFIWKVVARLFGGKITFTQHPTFRIHMAGTPSVSAWHTDYEVTGRTDQITAWMPFVTTFDSNTIWVESGYGNSDFVPIPVRYGEVLLFDGCCLQHGSVPNETDISRVSMDFRFVPMKEFSIETFFPQRKREVLS